jgi:PAT family beta-lactamase induction signal transducer AmpG
MKLKILDRSFLRQMVQRQLQVTLYLGFFSGLPIALCGSTLQAWFTVAGINIVAIGMLTLVGQPYVYKFLWAPLLDRYLLPWGGRRRGWILLTQVALALVIAGMAFLNPAHQSGALALLALLIALFSATQDIAIDAYRTDLLNPSERGVGAAMVTIGYRIAMWVSGGVALILAAKLGWHFTYLLMAALMLLGIGVTLWSPEPIYNARPPKTLQASIIEPFREFWSRNGKLALLLFIIFYKLTDAFALTLSTTFFIRGIGFSLVEVGMAYKTIGIFAGLLGSLIGGILMIRLGVYRSLWYFGILQGASNLMFVWLAMVGKSLSLLVSVVFVESFCSGLGTVALVAFLMSLCDHRYTATQFALFSAISAIGRVFVGPLAGIMQEHWGWVTFYWGAFAMAIPGLVLLWWLRDKIDGRNKIVSSAVGYSPPK